MDNLKNFATALMTDLVNRGIVAKDVGGTWTLTQPIFGYSGDIAFHSKDELIQKLVQGAVAQYGGQTNLRAAV